MVVNSDPIRVLHVEDDPEYARVVAEFLHRADDSLEVESAADSPEALSLLAAAEFDCVVSDYELPDSNGLELLEAVRDRDPGIPFILFTNKGSEEIASEAISVGVSDYLQKDSGSDHFAVLANRIEKAVERATAQADRRRQLQAIETAQEGISILDEDGRFEFVNRAYADLYGYDPEAMIGECWELTYRDEDVPEMRDEILPTLAETGYWHGTTTGRRADGTTFTEDHVLSTTVNGELVCTVRDVTERQEIQEKHELVAKASTDAFWDWDPATDRISRNREYLSTFGYERADIGEETDWWRDRIHPEDRDRVLSALERAVDDPECTYDETYRFRRKDGDYGHLRTRGYVVYDDDDGEPDRMVGAHIDVTERIERERELKRQNERLDEFTRIVSHDLRNPLNVASGHLALARAECGSEALGTAEDAIDRCDALIGDLLQLARQGADGIELESVELARLIENCWRTVETDDATLDVDFDRAIRADPGSCKQLVENLVRNSVVHGGNSVTVTIGRIDGEGFYFADDGRGIPEADRDDVFESGYTTSDEGTGFGLTIVRRIVDDHGWEIDVVASTSGGARFEITGVEFV